MNSGIDWRKMNKMNIKNRLGSAINCSRAVMVLLFGVTFLAISSAANGGPKPGGVTRAGNPFTPSGADFSITALQGIDASDPFGKSGFSPQVNENFESNPSIGVSFDQGNGTLTDFGLGLYQNTANQVQSTGLDIQYNLPVDAASVTITVEDFDLKAGDTNFNFAQKVAPTILLLQGNSIYATATPSDIFPNLVAATTTNQKGDVWNVSFSGLLSTLGKADAPITGFILSADSVNGETPNSDPYLLVTVGNGTAVPEPTTYLLVFAGSALGILFRRITRCRD